MTPVNLSAMNYQLNLTSNPSWSNLRGADYQPKALCGCNVGSLAPPTSSFSEIRSNGWNLIKVYLSWNAYVNNTPAFMSSLNDVANSAESQGIYVIYTMGATANSPCNDNVWPCAMYANYGGTGPTPQFWNALWANQIMYDGTDSWTAQWNSFWLPIINAVDSNPSTLGYEILNEPQNPGGAPLSQLQNYNQFFAQKMRLAIQSSHYVMFMAPCPACGYNLNSSTPISVAPTGISNLAIDFHNYADYSSVDQAGPYFAMYSQVSQQLNIPVLIGEWAVCGISSPDTCASMSQSAAGPVVQAYENYFHQYGFANTYFDWECGSGYWGLLQKTTCNQYWLDTDIVSSQGSSTGSTTTTSTQTTSTINSSTTASKTSMSTHTTSSESTTTSITSSSSISTILNTPSQVPFSSTSSAANSHPAPPQSNLIIGIISAASSSRDLPAAYGLATYEVFLIAGLFGVLMIHRRSFKLNSRGNHGWHW